MNKKLIIALVIICVALFIGIMFLIKNTDQSGDLKTIDPSIVVNQKDERPNSWSSEKNDNLQETLLENLDASTRLKVYEVDSISNALFNVVEGLKKELLSSIDDASNYDEMDVSNQLLFKNNSEKGQVLVKEINSYRENLIKRLDSDFPELTREVQVKFKTRPEIAADGKKIDWLIANFYEFSLVNTLAKLTQIQIDIESVKSEVFTKLTSSN